MRAVPATMRVQAIRGCNGPRSGSETSSTRSPSPPATAYSPRMCVRTFAWAYP